MDTNEARRRMRDLAREALNTLENDAADAGPRGEAGYRLRAMEQEARVLLADAGYPGEAVWRALQRASQASQSDAQSDSPDSDALVDLREALETLESLTAAASERDSDFRIVG
jgi:hypothetical protein